MKRKGVGLTKKPLTVHAHSSDRGASWIILLSDSNNLTIIHKVSVCLTVCLFPCLQSLSTLSGVGQRNLENR